MEFGISYCYLLQTSNDMVCWLFTVRMICIQICREKCSPEHRGDPNDPCGRLKRDCVGIMAAFKLKQPFHHAVAHLYWDPRLADVKLAQAEYLLARLAQFKTLVTDRFECTPPSLILTGDFNSTPGQASTVCNILNVVSYVFRFFSILFLVTLHHRIDVWKNFPFPCAVFMLRQEENHYLRPTPPPFTNTLDYIFFSPSDSLMPASILQLLELDSGALSNYSHPSDHLPIGAKFEITKDQMFILRNERKSVYQKN
ncbi:hypothetical protein Gotur_013102 [Gossypium turneri]